MISLYRYYEKAVISLFVVVFEDPYKLYQLILNWPRCGDNKKNLTFRVDFYGVHVHKLTKSLPIWYLL